jgi:hypothetical protein
MRALMIAMALTVSLPMQPVMAQAPPSTAPAQAHYTTDGTAIGTILDDPAARAIVDKYIPGFSSGENIDMARSRTLKAIQRFSGDTITDKTLADIDAEFAKLPPKK